MRHSLHELHLTTQLSYCAVVYQTRSLAVADDAALDNPSLVRPTDISDGAGATRHHSAAHVNADMANGVRTPHLQHARFPQADSRR